MSEYKIQLCQLSKDPNVCHSVGVILINPNQEILLLDRRKGVLGWACPAGHKEKNEENIDCAIRELEEETGLKVDSADLRLLLTAYTDNACNGAQGHNWAVFVGNLSHDRIQLGEPDKHKGIGWFKWEEIQHLALEPVWRVFLDYWDKKE